MQQAALLWEAPNAALSGHSNGGKDVARHGFIGLMRDWQQTLRMGSRLLA
ncbi:MAG: hypothetical protein ABI618_02965 [Nitrospirota bacterium]